MYKRNYTAFKYFAIRYVPYRDAARDVIHETLVRVWEKGGTYPTEQDFLDYTYRALRNNCLTWLRNDRRANERHARMEVPEPEESFVDNIIEAELFAIINEIFAELPPATRRVYAESLAGKSHKEIADELNIAITTIKKHKTNANNYLRERLKKLLLLIATVG